ncbi:MAG: hypothetical protein LLF83_03100 [Methanobacterium sp.]|nr:hypothetical protein [Methanobacterium sp.]
MNKVIITVLIIILAIVGISGCTEQTPENKTYSADGITFQYPGNWTELNKTKYNSIDLGNKSEAIFVLGDDQNQSRLTFGKITPGQGEFLNSLAVWAEQTKSKSSSNDLKFLSEKNLTIAGVDAYQLRFINTDGDYITSIALIKNNTGYVMVYRSIFKETETLESILKSFQMP